MGPWRAMSNLLLNLSKKVLKFLYKMKQGPRGGGKGGELAKSMWASRKKIAQGPLDKKYTSPRAITENAMLGKCQKNPWQGESRRPRPVWRWGK